MLIANSKVGTSELGCSSVIEYMPDTAEAPVPFQHCRGGELVLLILLQLPQNKRKTFCP